LAMFVILTKLTKREFNLIREIRVYKMLIISSAIFTAFVTGANAIGILVSAGLLFAPFYVVSPIYAIASALGIYYSSKKASIVVGFRVTRLGYVSATSALLGSDIISEIFTVLGIPISITQTAMGGVIGLSLRNFGHDVKRQVYQVARGWATSPIIAIISSLAAFGIIKSILGF
ncbi:inorganic phosphate transporter, partial [Acidianus sp. RZ1]|uniref:inorganic phosphate transporter n=1 Tax=Acidianus sp. RZ1 TaxID=1540082 RepID=UPI0014917FEA